jgi:phosphatidylglycerophosphate synthase
MLRNIAENKVEAILARIAPVLVRRKITPNSLTYTGLFFSFVAAYLLYCGFMVIGGVLVVFAGFFDMLDGAVARSEGSVSKIGGFTDSVIDRYSDFVIFGGLLAHFASHGDFGKTILVAVIICGAFLVSYVRARAELVIPKCAVGVMERPERIILLAAGCIFGFLTAALWILAFTTHLTALHRIHYTHNTYNSSSDK